MQINEVHFSATCNHATLYVMCLSQDKIKRQERLYAHPLLTLNGPH